MTVRKIFELFDTRDLEGWHISIYDLLGTIQYGFINSIHPAENIHPAILDQSIESFSLGYNSMYIRINPLIEAEYQTAEKCIMDGYEFIDLKPFNNCIKKENNNLYVTRYHNGWSFAKVI